MGTWTWHRPHQLPGLPRLGPAAPLHYSRSLCGLSGKILKADKKGVQAKLFDTKRVDSYLSRGAVIDASPLLHQDNNVFAGFGFARILGKSTQMAESDA